MDAELTSECLLLTDAELEDFAVAVEFWLLGDQSEPPRRTHVETQAMDRLDALTKSPLKSTIEGWERRIGRLVEAESKGLSDTDIAAAEEAADVVFCKGDDSNDAERTRKMRRIMFEMTVVPLFHDAGPSPTLRPEAFARVAARRIHKTARRIHKIVTDPPMANIPNGPYHLDVVLPPIDELRRACERAESVLNAAIVRPTNPSSSSSASSLCPLSLFPHTFLRAILSTLAAKKTQ